MTLKEMIHERPKFGHLIGFFFWDASMLVILVITYVGINSISEKMGPVNWDAPSALLVVGVQGLNLVSYALPLFLAWVAFELVVMAATGVRRRIKTWR